MAAHKLAQPRLDTHQSQCPALQLVAVRVIMHCGVKQLLPFACAELLFIQYHQCVLRCIENKILVRYRLQRDYNLTFENGKQQGEGNEKAGRV